MTVDSTWIKINYQYASLMNGGTNDALKRIHVQGKNGKVMVNGPKLLELANGSGYPAPGNIFFEYDTASPNLIAVPKNEAPILGIGPNAQGEYESDLALTNISQSTGYTCQSACIAMIKEMGMTEMQIRSWLQSQGNPGDPHIMGDLMAMKLGDRYQYNGEASINEMIGYLKLGYYLIFHVFFTGPGHVIGLDGYDNYVRKLAKRWAKYPECHEGISSKDPWSEFSFEDLRYSNPNSNFFDGYYPLYGLWAAGVRAFSYQQMVNAWRGKVPANWRNEKRGYCHIIKPADWREREAAVKK